MPFFNNPCNSLLSHISFNALMPIVMQNAERRTQNAERSARLRMAADHFSG